MKVLVLDKFMEEEATCLLCKTSLAEFVRGLPLNFRDYYVQRGIVTNHFLDNLWDTLSNGRHIPPIVLVGDNQLPNVNARETFTLEDDFRVLDGLQRSHRLKEIWDTIEFIDQQVTDREELPVARYARQQAQHLRANHINPQIFQKILETKREGRESGKSLFEQNNIWLEVWFNLTESLQIRKMLILNAGHKSVNIKHQIELLFWSNFGALQAALAPAFIVREKDKASAAYSKERQAGEFHFAHIISAFVSLTEGGTVTTNAEFTAAHSFRGENATDESLLDIDDRQLAAFSRTLSHLDRTFRSDAGIRWLGREVVLVGIFGAIGAFAKETRASKVEALEAFDSRVHTFADDINLKGFESWRNNLELSKVNIGSINKRTVYRATLNFLTGRTQGPVEWQNIAREFNNDAS